MLVLFILAQAAVVFLHEKFLSHFKIQNVFWKRLLTGFPFFVWLYSLAIFHFEFMWYHVLIVIVAGTIIGQFFFDLSRDYKGDR